MARAQNFHRRISHSKSTHASMAAFSPSFWYKVSRRILCEHFLPALRLFKSYLKEERLKQGEGFLELAWAGSTFTALQIARMAFSSSLRSHLALTVYILLAGAVKYPSHASHHRAPATPHPHAKLSLRQHRLNSHAQSLPTRNLSFHIDSSQHFTHNYEMVRSSRRRSHHNRSVLRPSLYRNLHGLHRVVPPLQGVETERTSPICPRQAAQETETASQRHTACDGIS
jgi:hypothetical protein